MKFSVNNFKELKLLVECIDVERISSTIENANGWGTAGVGFLDASENPPEVMPVSGAGRPGTIGLSCIVTQNPKAFVWFAKTILSSDKLEPTPVKYYELLPVFHLAYCMSHSESNNYDIKEELLYICDFLIQQNNEDDNHKQTLHFYEEEDKD